MPETTYADHAANLNSARKGSLKNSAKKAKKTITDIINTESLLKYIHPFIDWLFGVAISLAILKDTLDIPDTALIPVLGIGEIITIILTFFISIIIFVIIIITGSAGRARVAKNTIKKLIAIISTGLIEIIPAIDLLPMETILVIATFWMTLKERQRDAQENDQPGQ